VEVLNGQGGWGREFSAVFTTQPGGSAVEIPSFQGFFPAAKKRGRSSGQGGNSGGAGGQLFPLQAFQ